MGLGWATAPFGKDLEGDGPRVAAPERLARYLRMTDIHSASGQDRIEAIVGLFEEARAQVEQNRWRAAATALTKLLSIDPQVPEALGVLAYVRYEQRRYEDVIDCCERCVAVAPDNGDAHFLLARSLYKTGRLHEAFEYLRRHFGHMQHSTDAQQFAYAMHVHNETLKGYGIDPAGDRESLATALYRKGLDLFRAGDTEQATVAFDAYAEYRVPLEALDVEVGSALEVEEEHKPTGAYLSCDELEHCIHFHDERLRFCCTYHNGGKGWTKAVDFHGGALPIDAVAARRVDTIRKLNSGVETDCSGCHKLAKREWARDDKRLNRIIINSYSVCNFRCSYCNLTKANFEMPGYYYSTERAFDDLVAKDWLREGAIIVWGGGDPCVSREFAAATRNFTAHGCITNTNTNASIGIPALRDALSAGLAVVLISVDSGSKAAFYRVKLAKPGANEDVLFKSQEAFSAVWRNIADYVAADPDNVRVKYIFLPENSTRAEVRQFIDNCVEAKVRQVMFTPEGQFMRRFPLHAEDLPADMLDAMKFAATYATQQGLSVAYYNYFPAEIFRPDTAAADATPGPVSDVDESTIVY